MSAIIALRPEYNLITRGLADSLRKIEYGLPCDIGQFPRVFTSLRSEEYRKLILSGVKEQVLTSSSRNPTTLSHRLRASPV